ncbi:MAG: hypothetical protein FWF82_03150 [Oscillospiraceae bacterium]|nr:hypothetical protein [Oscillospiraceae bacterium]
MKRIISVIVTATIMAGMTFPVSAESNLDWWCTVCENLGGNPDCDCYILGDVNGDGVVDFLDLHEIMHYSAKLPSIFTTGAPSIYTGGDVIYDGLRTHKAACIVNREKYMDAGGYPWIFDALEICKFMAGLDSKIPFDGNNPNRFPIAVQNDFIPRDYPVRAVIDDYSGDDGGLVRFILTEDYSGFIAFHYEITGGADVKFFAPSGPPNSRYLPDGLQSYFAWNNPKGVVNSLIYLAEYPDGGKVPAGTVILSQEFEGATHETFRKIKISDVVSAGDNGDGWKVNETKPYKDVSYITCETEGCKPCGNPARAVGDVDGDGVITIQDAVEIMRYLAKLKSDIDNNDFAYKAACVRGGDSPGIKDALAIMKILAKV